MNIMMWILVAYLVIVVLKTIKCPTVWDSFLGFSIVSSKAILILVAFASINDVGYLLDVALIYAMFGILGEIFIILFLGNRLKEGKEE